MALGCTVSLLWNSWHLADLSACDRAGGIAVTATKGYGISTCFNIISVCDRLLTSLRYAEKMPELCLCIAKG